MNYYKDLPFQIMLDVYLRLKLKSHIQTHKCPAHAIRKVIYLTLALTNSWLAVIAWQLDKYGKPGVVSVQFCSYLPGASILGRSLEAKE